MSGSTAALPWSGTGARARIWRARARAGAPPARSSLTGHCPIRRCERPVAIPVRRRAGPSASRHAYGGVSNLSVFMGVRDPGTRYAASRASMDLASGGGLSVGVRPPACFSVLYCRYRAASGEAAFGALGAELNRALQFSGTLSCSLGRPAVLTDAVVCVDLVPRRRSPVRSFKLDLPFLQLAPQLLRRRTCRRT